ncbi:MAG: hypothetical protein ACE366_08945 [Bradymonadia bacterium]
MKALRLGDPYAIDLRWPRAQGEVALYRLFKNTDEVATFKVKGDAHPEAWSGTVQGRFIWTLVAEDSQGRRSSGITTESEPIRPLAPSGGVIALRSKASTADMAEILGRMSNEQVTEPGAGLRAPAGALGVKGKRGPEIVFAPPEIMGGADSAMVQRVTRPFKGALKYCVHRAKLPAGKHRADLKWIVALNGYIMATKLESGPKALSHCFDRQSKRMLKFPPPNEVFVILQPMEITVY